MAIQEQLEKLQRGVNVWNAWRSQQPRRYIDLSGANLSRANLSGANLSGSYLTRDGLSGANLSGANLSSTNLSGANLSSTNLSGANLSGANLSEAYLNEAYLTKEDLIRTDLIRTDLSGARLIRTDLSGAHLIRTDLSGARLNRANLSGAILSEANLSGAILSEANLTRAAMHRTILNDVDLRSVKGLESIRHRGPSGITTSTLERSEGDIPDQFLKGVGLSDESISYARSFLQHPIQYYTCFISYSSYDQEFAERLYADLQQKGIRCWFAPHSLKIGDHFPKRIEEAIRVYDKLLLILSQDSVQSEWVEDEVRAALEKEEQFRKEQQQERTVLFPIQIDTVIERTSTQWAAKLRRTRHIGNFQSWKDHDSYKKAFDRLLRDLKAEPKDTRENTP